MSSISINNLRGVATRRIRAVLILVACAAPLVALVLKGAPRFFDGLLVHLVGTVLPTQLLTSLTIAIGAVLVGAFFASGGILCGLFRFPGHRLLGRLLLVPLLVPPWYLAVLYQDTLGLAGRLTLVVVLAAGSAPLIQLLVTAALRSIPSRYVDVLRQLGRASPWEVIRLLLPLALPAFAAAAVLVFFLAWADEASARILAVPTLTVGLYDQWFGRQDDAAGAPLALAILLLSLLPAWAIWAWLTRGSFRSTARLQGRGMTPVPLRGAAVVVPWLLSVPLLIVGVLYPAWVVVSWTVERLRWVNLATIGMDLMASLVLAIGGTLVAALLALALLQQQITAQSRVVTGATTLAVMGSFAIPPLVLALAWLWMLPERSGSEWIIWLNSTPLPLIVALGLRFCAVFLVSGKAALLRVARAHGDVLRVLGRTDFISFVRLFWPFITGPMSAVACLIFLAALQDLSLSLVLQPFGFTTISSRVFQYAQAQRIPDCAVWMLCQALVGLYPLVLLARWADRAHDRGSA
jgi:iron(III) transport system permease protein